MSVLNQVTSIELEIRSREEIVKVNHEFKSEPQLILKDKIQRGEYYTFQVVIKSTERDITDITLERTNLVSQQAMIDGGYIVCFNQQKVSYQGLATIEPIDLIKDDLKVLWFGISIPENQQVGIYVGAISIKKKEELLGQVQLSLDVAEEVLGNHSVEDLEKQSRLFWMNSTKALDNRVTKNYLPIQLEDRKIKILGREIRLDKSGFPKQITSYYNDRLEIVEQETSILNKPINFNIETQAGERFTFNQEFKIEKVSEDQVIWSNSLEDEKVKINLRAELQYEGWMQYTINITAKEQIDLKHTELIITYPKEMAKYMMGLGVEGGTLPAHYEWKWDEKKHQDAVWIGNVNGGIKCQLKDNTYTSPLVNVYFNQRYLKPPKAWDNEGKGGLTIRKSEEEVYLKIYTQEYILKENEERNFEFECLITPLKPIDYTKHWRTRYYHPNENTKVGNEWIEMAKQEGCNYTIVHHGQKAHPFINYPFIEVGELKSLVNQAHAENIGLKVYYTIREMSNHAAEFWPWYHLGLFPKASETQPVFWEGKKELWAQRVFGRKVIPAWEHEFREGKYKGDVCSALIVEPNSQMDNYYIEGLDWLVKEIGIDGIYIDDTSIGRETLRRARKTLDQKENSLIDMHSWNHLNTHAGYANSALIYMNLFPYIDSLWYGEGFDYDKPPEYWLIELSGIPYGLMGQMLEGGGNPYRGMLYGMTNRTGWGNRSALPFYQLWDEFGIQDAKMYGYWSKECPVKTDCQKILATAYVKKEKTMIVLASWAEEERAVEVQIDWESIGLKENKVNILLPNIAQIQEEKKLKYLTLIQVKPKKGAFIIISKNDDIKD